MENSSFFHLDPNTVLKMAEEVGFHPTGELYQLNSYENRVFDIRMENRSSCIVKFYRPGRWSREAILEEHEFLFDLQGEGISVVAPLKFHGTSLLKCEDMWVAFFPKMRGRMPDELLEDDFIQVGRLLARLHNVGSQKPSRHRPTFDSSYYGGWKTLQDLQSWIAPEVRSRYNHAAETILNEMDGAVDPHEFIRVHGDCHRGNLLHTGRTEELPNGEYFLIDFDDFGLGPTIQDFWMLISGDQSEAQDQLTYLADGYEELREFPYHQIDWIPLYRGLRIISYAGWIAKRWQDPSFPRLFPEFGTYSYWADETEALEKIIHSWT